MPKSSTSFDKENQPKKRKPRGKSKRNLMLDAMKEVCGSEEEFFRTMLKVAIGGMVVISVDEDGKEEKAYKSPVPMLMAVAADKVEPSLKSVSPSIKFPFKKKDKPHEQILGVMCSVAKGEIPPDLGNAFIQSMKSMIDIEEYTDLKERIEKLEKALAGES